MVLFWGRQREEQGESDEEDEEEDSDPESIDELEENADDDDDDADDGNDIMGNFSSITLGSPFPSYALCIEIKKLKLGYDRERNFMDYIHVLQK